MINLALCGTGFIADYFMSLANKIDDLTVAAVLGIDQTTANEFADKYNIKKSYSDYDQILADKEIQFVYIALPNNLHYPFAKKALLAQKHVIVEKPFVATAAQIDELIRLAKNNHVMIFDAIITKYIPLMDTIRENIDRVGDIRSITSDYCQYSHNYEMVRNGKIPSVFDLHKDGGALKDLGIYPITFIVSLFGKPKEVNYYANKLPNGCDTSGTIVMKYEKKVATIRIAKDSFTENRCTIEGLNGTLFVDSDSYRFPNLRFKETNENESVLLGTFTESGLVNEFNVFVNIYKNNEYEKSYQLVELGKNVIEVLNEAAESANIVYGK